MEKMILEPGYSSDVRLQLLVDNQALELEKIGPGYVVFRDPPELPECDAEVLMTVSGREHRWGVRLHEGAVPFEDKVAVRPRA